MSAERYKTPPPRKPYLRSVVEPLWDINASHDDGSPGLLAMLLTRPQLLRTREVQFPSDTCRSCGLLIAPLGYGAYRPAFHLGGELHPSPGCDVCKACYIYSEDNPLRNAADAWPPGRASKNGDLGAWGVPEREKYVGPTTKAAKFRLTTHQVAVSPSYTCGFLFGGALGADRTIAII
ncbi:hypothetical protein DFH07DRAFT_783504 [Mycena maculata]|uniref:Uncharacterized protein n=1 Tax=Mycena maculata TaxID=230809 RepID=A0AAD7HLP9_9AGAR|nr:hypothetical protein DFH07DRAFT_783504 [Mycena maculata]